MDKSILLHAFTVELLLQCNASVGKCHSMLAAVFSGLFF